MIFIGLLVLLEGLVLLGFFELSWKLSFLLLFYVSSYFDGKEFTGERRWPQFRKFRLWQYLSPSRENYISAQNDLLRRTVKTRGCLYLLRQESTSFFPMFWAIGLGLPESAPHVSRTFFVIDHFYFRIPLLRDILLWSGAISDRSNIIKLLNERKHICIKGTLSDELLRYSLDQKSFIVPILVRKDKERYFCFERSPYLFMSIPRWWQRRHPPSPLETIVGTVISCDIKFNDSEDQLNSFIETWFESTLALTT